MDREKTKNEPVEGWIARARRGKTKAYKAQAYLNKEEEEWFRKFMEENNLGVSAATRLCIRHVMVEHKMKELGRARLRENEKKNGVNVGALVGLRGDNGRPDED